MIKGYKTATNVFSQFAELVRELFWVSPQYFYLSVMMGVLGRFGNVLQFVGMLQALIDSVTNELTKGKLLVYIGLVVGANVCKYLKLQAHKAFASCICQSWIASRFNRVHVRRKVDYAKFKYAAYIMSGKVFSIFECLVFVVFSVLGLAWFSPMISFVMILMSGMLFVVFSFVDFRSTRNLTSRQFEKYIVPLSNIVRVDTVFGVAVVFCAYIFSFNTTLAIESPFILVFVFLIRYLIGYVKEIQRSIVYITSQKEAKNVIYQFNTYSRSPR